MRKSLAVISILALNVVAAEHFFAGGDVTHSKIEFENSNKEFSNNYMNWKLGYQNENYRLYTQYRKEFFKFNENKTFTLNADYLHQFTSKFKGFVGGAYNRITLDSSTINDSKIANRFGFQTGILYEYDNDWSFEGGYRHSPINKTLQDALTREDIDRINSIFIGLNYKFGEITKEIPKTIEPKPTPKIVVEPKVVEKPTLDIGDSDNDGVKNYLDKCPNTLANSKVDANGCIILDMDDDDSDGVPNHMDKCPNTPLNSEVNINGCIILDENDSDNDGVKNYLDKCPNTLPNSKVDANGCIILDMGDDDSDGVPNHMDRCPNTPSNALVDANGCIVSIKLRTLFKVDSAVLSDDAKPKLNNMAQVLNDNRYLFAKILGHTDSDGSKKYNKKLSQKRVDSVINYLVSKGVDKNSLEGVGYGEEQPIESNKTPEGKQKNRRVEIELYIK
jgi:OOP family OmpA-OmpF porin